jgi:hypothetical protein
LQQAIPQLIAEGPSGKPLPSPITIELPPASNSASTPSARPGSAGILTATPSAQDPNASNSHPVARVLEAGATPRNDSNSDPLSALKSQLTASQQGSGVQQSSSIQTGNAPAHSAASALGISAAQQSASNAQTNSPPQAASNSEGNLPPAIIRVPQEDLKPLYDAVEDCEACHAKLAAAQGDLSDERAKFAAATAQRDAAIAAARGTFWTRTRRAAKWIIIGAAAGAVLSRYH